MKLKEIAEKLNLDLVFLNKDNCSYDDFTEYCAITVKGRTVYVGLFADKEYELIAFFHEVGHSIITQDFMKKWDYNTLVIEIECWNLGLEKARELGILFTDRAIRWGYEKALTYVGNDEREIKDFDKSKYWINK